MFWAGTDTQSDLWIPVDGRRVPIRWLGTESLEYNFIDDIEDFYERTGNPD
jgi:hypothetical protein